MFKLSMSQGKNHKALLTNTWNAGQPGRRGRIGAGFSNRSGSAEQFNNPTDICVDNDGTVYVPDMSSNRIRTIVEKK